MKRFILFAVFTLSLFSESKSQEMLSDTGDWGLRAGISMQVGTHANSFGLFVQAYYQYKAVRLHGRVGTAYHINNYGPPFDGLETVYSLGTSIGWNTVSEQVIPELFDEATKYLCAFGYTFNYYSSKMATSQRIGTLNLRFGRFGLSHENDLFGKSGSDRFRTAGISLHYYDSLRVYGIRNILWTGDVDHPKAKRGENAKVARYGYIDLSDTPYGAYSHGIVAVFVKQQLPFGNFADISVGIDHEKIRNVMQNKFIHDMPMIPSAWNKAKNRQILMVDEKGKGYLYQPDQKLSPIALYLQGALNEVPFY